MQRREFLRVSAVAAGAAAWRAAAPAATADPGPESLSGSVMTVRGLLPVDKLGFVLPHEHVLVDFVGAAEIKPERYDADIAFNKIKPYLDRVRALGGGTMFECTPAFLGRDPRLLVRLSEATGLHLVTNTGYYSARQNKFLPAHALVESADALAARWLREWKDGIEQTGVRPGFIKIGLDAGPLTEQGRKLVQAAARTHRASGLTVAAHTGDDVAARAQLDVLREEGVQPAAWIWVHAHNARDESALVSAARAGAWVGLDGLSPRSLTRGLHLITMLRQEGCLARVLLSHDAGWYRPGEPDGGAFRDYEMLFTVFIPTLRKNGFTDLEIHQLTTLNPARAFAIRPRLS